MLRLRSSSPPVPHIADSSCCAISHVGQCTGATAAPAVTVLICRPRVLGDCEERAVWTVEQFARNCRGVRQVCVEVAVAPVEYPREWIVAVAPLPNWSALLVGTCDRPAGCVDPACTSVVV